MHGDNVTPPWDTALGGRWKLAVELAWKAGNLTRDEYFQSDRYQTERKRDNSPVTTADKASEQLIRSLIAEAFPNDGVLGEEFGGELGQAEYEWIVDPIDGTKSFISGVPLYSTLVGIQHRGTSAAGVIYVPGTYEIVTAASGQGAWYAKGTPSQIGAWKPTHVSRVNSLADGLFVTSQVDNFAKRGASIGYEKLEKLAYITRTWGDGYGYLLVATGRAEVMVDPIVSPWDIAAILPILQEAGGRCSSWTGEFNVQAGDCVGSNGWVHDAVLKALNP